MAGGVPRAKGAVRQDWTCKSGVSKRGRAVVNWGTALKCQGCRLPNATSFGANVPLPAAAKWKSKSGGAMEVDVGEGAGAGDAAALAEVHMCESGLHALKDQTADWAAAKARLFASKPLHARTHAIANKAKRCAERLEKAESNKRKTQEALRRAVGEVERAQKVHADLLEQQMAALQAELVQLQQQDVIGGLGITVGELEAVVLQQLSAHSNEEQPVPAEAQKRTTGALGVRFVELCMSKRARREEAPAEEPASASQDVANAAREVRAGAERDGQSQPAPEAAVPGSGSGSAVVPRWQPGESVEQLQQRLRKRGLELEAGASSLTRILLILSAWFGAMAKSGIFAASVAAGGSLAPCVEGICERAEAVVLLVQERRAKDHDRLAAFQQAVLDHGCAGLWAPAVQGPRGEAGASGGVAVHARSHIVVTSPLFLDSTVLLAARLVAAHVHWGVAGGFVAISAYFHGSVRWNADNQHVAAVLMKYLAKFSAAGIDWVVGGDFNMGPEKFPVQQLHGVRGLWAAAGDDTCRPRAGAWSTLDYFLFAADLAPRLDRPRVDEYGATKPRLPVAMEVHAQDFPMQVRVARGPRPIGPVPPVGCSRGVEDWRRPLAKVRAAVSREHLLEAWGAVVATVEQELLDRCDVVGHDKTKCVGRSGALETTLVAVKWRPPRRRTALGGQLHGVSLLCPLFETQFDKLAGFLMEAATYLDKIIASRGALALLPHWVQDFFGQQMLMFAQADFAGQASRVVEYANGQYEAALAAQEQEWVKWVNGSFSHGAGRAHRCSKVRDLQEVVTAWRSQQQDASPHLVCDREMQPRAKVWRCHGLPQARRPAATEEWDALPELTVDEMKRAALSFPAGTAMGRAKIGMRALSFLSEDGMYVCAQLFMRIEKLGPWPEGRLWHAMRRLLEPSGGCRILALMHSFAHWWSRRRADISKGWLAQHPNVVTVLLDAWKFFEAVIPEALMQEARLLKMPLSLVWLLELYRQPRRLQAFGSVSYEVVSYQRLLAGCTHACALVSVLMHGPSNWAPSCSPPTSGYVTSSKGLAAACRKHAGSRGLQLLRWARNLGHDLGGGRVQRRQTKLRLKAPARRRGRLAALKRAAGRKVAVLWRTGLLLSAGRGAGVVGIPDSELQRLQAEASRLAGARPGPSGATIYLATQRSARFDPVYAATMALMVRYSSWVWEQRASLGRRQRAWASIMQRLVEKPTWGLARGPIASTTLALWRIGWYMWSSLVLVTDEEQRINLLATSPSDLKAYLVEGVSRWQGRQILSHFGGAQPTGPI
ncbi:unnamed protein product [Prorocentrum cordatum]|uniref:Endonuclease/exonuclease/phosphatase domain-containing protein n=1 Tax=Prorocentrum cordatum TaxID=2364126 RepID=A0ABN9YC03_9DINO|nr:unnamed protein product [Polarella glacialis]